MYNNTAYMCNDRQRNLARKLGALQRDLIRASSRSLNVRLKFIPK